MNTFVVRLLILPCFVLSVCRAQSDPHDLAQEYIGFSTLQEAGVESANSPNSKSVSQEKNRGTIMTKRSEHPSGLGR